MIAGPTEHARTGVRSPRVQATSASAWTTASATTTARKLHRYASGESTPPVPGTGTQPNLSR